MREKLCRYYENIDDRYFDKGKKRFDWVDICKGILILAVVFGHASAKVAPYVYMYHIPLFFFMSGYVERLEEKSFVQIFVQKLVSLYVPFVVVNVFYFGLRICLNLFDIQELFYDLILGKHQMISIIGYVAKMQWSSDLAGASWFLACLFVAFLLAKMIVVITRKSVNIFSVLLAAICYGAACLLDMLNVHLPYMLGVAFAAVFYLMLGSYIKKKNLFDYVTNIHAVLWLIIFLIYSYVFSQKFQACVDWGGGKLGHPVLTTVSVMLAAVILMNVTKSLQGTKVGEGLQFLGKRTLPLMLLHFAFFRLMYVVLYVLGVYPITILKNVVPPDNDWRGCLYAIFSVLLFIGVDRLFYKFLPYQWFFEGKIPVPKKIKENHFKKLSGILFVILFVALIYVIPFRNIVDSVIKYNMPYKIEGVYEDGFVGEELYITVELTKSSTVRFALSNPLGFDNSCQVFVDGELYEEYDIHAELLWIDVQMEEIGEHTIRVIFEQTFVPKELGTSEDIRDLSVILLNGTIEIK